MILHEAYRLWRNFLDSSLALNTFLSGVEKRAYQMANIATRTPDEALDIVQDAMLKLVEKYAEKPEEEWRYLFFKILQTRITDWHRRRKVRQTIIKCVKPFSNLSQESEFGEMYATHEQTRPTAGMGQPDHELERGTQIEALKSALEKLPLRQQQAFLLRLWEGFDVRQTAVAMSCSEGSVKTHYSRAVHSLREQLEQLK